MKWNKQIKIMVIRILSWGLLYQCPCSHSEPKATPTFPGGPPIPLGRILSLLCGQLRLWPVPIPVCACSQNPLLKIGLSCERFLISSDISQIYQADLGDLIYSLCNWMGRFPLLFLGFILGVQLWFWPHLCGTTTSDICSLPRWEGVKAEANWGFSSWGRV